MRQSSTIDLSQLPAPALIEALDAESYVAAAIADYRGRWPEFSAVLESEPVVKFIEVLAYRETMLRALVNTKARALLLAFAENTDLDHLGALFDVERMVQDGVREKDDRYRRRIQLAPEAFSVAGPAGAYEYWALTHSLTIEDAHAFSPSDGRVTLVLAGVDGTEVSDDVIAGLIDRLNLDDVVPLTDERTVVRAKRVLFDAPAHLLIPRGPDPALIEAASSIAIRAYARGRYRIGATVYAVGVTAAAKVGGVDNVTTVFRDIVCGQTEIPVLGAVAVTSMVI